MLYEEGIDAARDALWDAIAWHRDCSPQTDGNPATTGQRRVSLEMAVRIEKILCTVLHEAHVRQVEETMATLSEGPEGL